MRTDLPFWLRNLTIRGFEDDPKKKKDDKGEESEESDDDEGDDDDEGGDEDKDKKDPPENNDALKSALQKERRERKALAKQVRDLAKFKEETEGKDKSDTDKAKDDAAKSDAKNKKLASRLRDQAVDNAILKLGPKLKFRDMDDALQLIDRKLIDVEQDEDDPDEIEIDESTVEEALKQLAKKKPHLIIAEGQEDRSGSKFNGKKKSDKEVDEDALRGKYSALARSGHNEA